MDQWKYCKAVPLNDCNSIVYACQFTEDEFDFEEIPAPVFARGGFVRIAGHTKLISPDEWIVWLPTQEFFFLSDDEFRRKYTLYADLPPKIKTLADRHPAFEEWVAQCWLAALNNSVERKNG